MVLPKTFDINGVQIFDEGNWNGNKITSKDIDELINNFNSTNEFIKPFLKLGHDNKQKLVQKDGFPAVGWIENLRRSGTKLVADFKKVPKKIYDLIISGGFRKVSSEIFSSITVNGKKFKNVLKAVSLLGADIPAVQTLDDIISFYKKLGYENIKAFEENNTEVKVYVFEMEKSNKEATNMEALEKSILKADENQRKYEEEKAKVEEVNKEVVKQDKVIIEKDKVIEEKDKKIEEVTKEKEKVEGEIKENAIKSIKKEIEVQIDKFIADKKLNPADKDKKIHKLFALKMLTEEKKFKEGDKEKTLFDIEIEEMEKGKVDFNFEETSSIGDSKGNENNQALADKAMKYAKDNGVTYKEALIEISK